MGVCCVPKALRAEGLNGLLSCGPEITGLALFLHRSKGFSTAGKEHYRPGQIAGVGAAWEERQAQGHSGSQCQSPEGAGGRGLAQAASLQALPALPSLEVGLGKRPGA